MEKQEYNCPEQAVIEKKGAGGRQMGKKEQSVRLSMAGQVYAGEEKLSGGSDCLLVSDDETTSVDRTVDEESPQSTTEGKVRSEVTDPPPRQSLDNREKKDRPPRVNNAQDDDGIERGSSKEQTIRTNNGGLKSPVRRAEKRSGSSLLSRVDVDDQIVGEKHYVSSSATDRKRDTRKTCIIFALSILVVLAYGGGVYTGVVISEGRDSSMIKITPAPTGVPTLSPTVEKDHIP